MIRLQLDRSNLPTGVGSRQSPYQAFLRVSWWIALALGSVVVAIKDHVGTLFQGHPLLRAGAFAVCMILFAWLEKLTTRLYMNYAPSIFDRDSV